MLLSCAGKWLVRGMMYLFRCSNRLRSTSNYFKARSNSSHTKTRRVWFHLWNVFHGTCHIKTLTAVNGSAEWKQRKGAMRVVQIQQHEIGCFEAGSHTQPNRTIIRTSTHQSPIPFYWLTEGYNGFSCFLQRKFGKIAYSCQYDTNKASKELTVQQTLASDGEAN